MMPNARSGRSGDTELTAQPLVPLELPPLEAIDALSEDDLPTALAQLLALQARVTARLAVARGTAARDRDDRLLTLEEAAEQLQTTRDWLRRRRDLPFRITLSEGQVRYSAQALQRFIRTHVGK